nr:NXPE family member 1-like [Lytechinus pictus]
MTKSSFDPGKKMKALLCTNSRLLVILPAIIFIMSLVSSMLYEGSDRKFVHIPYRQRYWKDESHNAETSLRYSKYHIINRSDVYYVNDIIKILIEEYDSEGRPRRKGGAFFRAKLVSKDIKASARSDGEVVDLGNGQYQAEFVLRWPGNVTVTVMMVDSSPALNILERMWQEFPNRGTYIGHFKDGTNYEKTNCNVDHVTTLEKECDYTDNETNIHWYCERPSNPHLNCTHWWKHNSNNTFIFSQQTRFIRPGEEKHFVDYKKYLTCKDCSITVREKRKSNAEVDKYGRHPWQEPWHTLPKCLPGRINKFENTTSGYLYRDKWFSTRCRNRAFSSRTAAACLRNKTVLILADSTGKQLYVYYVHLLKMRELTTINCMGHAYSDSINFTIYYKFHGLPSVGMGGGPSKCLRQSVVNVLDHLAFIPDVFMLSITAHLTMHNQDYFRERMKIIRPAVERLHRRNPNTSFLIKSANTREFKTLQHVLANNEWYMYTLDRIVRESFADYPKVALIDAWDITVAQFNSDIIHPKPSTLASIADLTLSYICPI